MVLFRQVVLAAPSLFVFPADLAEQTATASTRVTRGRQHVNYAEADIQHHPSDSDPEGDSSDSDSDSESGSESEQSNSEEAEPTLPDEAEAAAVIETLANLADPASAGRFADPRCGISLHAAFNTSQVSSLSLSSSRVNLRLS